MDPECKHILLQEQLLATRRKSKACPRTGKNKKK